MKAYIFYFEDQKPWVVMVDKNFMATTTRKEIDQITEECIRFEVVDLNQDNVTIENGYQLEPFTVRYDHEWVYGGPEEGGWYYSMYTNPTKVSKHINNGDLFKYQITEVTYEEVVLGENEKSGREIYC